VDSTRGVGLVLAAVAAGLWAVVVVAVLMTGPEDGVNIGAALLALLALPLSVGATITLIVSRRDADRRGVSDSHPRARRIAVVLGIASVACLGGSMVTGQLESTGTAAVALVLLTAGIATFVASSVLFALPLPRQG